MIGSPEGIVLVVILVGMGLKVLFAPLYWWLHARLSPKPTPDPIWDNPTLSALEKQRLWFATHPIKETK